MLGNQLWTVAVAHGIYRDDADVFVARRLARRKEVRRAVDERRKPLVSDALVAAS